MENKIYVQIKLFTVFIYSPQFGQYQKSTYEQNGLIVRNHYASLPAPILQLSIELLQTILSSESNQFCKSFNKSQPIQIIVLEINQNHKDWINTFVNQNIKISILQSKDTTNGLKGENSLYNYIEKASPLNLQNKCDLSKRHFLNQLPQQYLCLQLSNHVQIFRVKHQTKSLIYQSNLDQRFHLNIIINILKKNNKQLLLHPLSHIITQIMINGNHQSTDLLVEDIFGAEMCGFIGLPPKLIASSLGKFSKRNKDDQFILWDQLKSILIAFAINLGQQINKQMHSTKIYTAVLQPNQFNSPQFLHVVQGIVGFNGQLWFDGNRNFSQFAQKLKYCNESQ